MRSHRVPAAFRDGALPVTVRSLVGHACTPLAMSDDSEPEEDSSMESSSSGSEDAGAAALEEEWFDAARFGNVVALARLLDTGAIPDVDFVAGLPLSKRSALWVGAFYGRN